MRIGIVGVVIGRVRFAISAYAGAYPAVFRSAGLAGKLPPDTGRAMSQEKRGPGTRPVRQPRWRHRAAAELPAPHLEWYARGDCPDVYRDHGGFRMLAARFVELFARQQCEPLGFLVAGADVVVPLRWTMRGQARWASFIERFQPWVFHGPGRLRVVGGFATKKQPSKPSGWE
jgi:hypothetical protein